MQITYLTNPISAGLQDGDIFIPVNSNTGFYEEPLVYDSSKLSHRLKSMVAPGQALTIGSILCYAWHEFPRLLFVDLATKTFVLVDEKHFPAMFGLNNYADVKEYVSQTSFLSIKEQIGWLSPSLQDYVSTFKVKAKPQPKWTLGKNGVVYANN